MIRDTRGGPFRFGVSSVFFLNAWSLDIPAYDKELYTRGCGDRIQSPVLIVVQCWNKVIFIFLKRSWMRQSGQPKEALGNELV